MKKILCVIGASLLALSPAAAAAGPIDHAADGRPDGPGLAVRVSPPAPAGLRGLPFAPEGLEDCADMEFYRVQWGLPERFIKIGWRESNCRNEDGVKTFCCYGRYQLYVGLHLKDPRLAPRYAECGIASYQDVNSDDPLEKQKQACGAKAVLDVQGINAWVATK